MTIPLGVVVSREAIDNPWQDHVWQPVSVFLDAEPISAWRTLRTGTRFVHYHAATVPLELHRRETAGYLANLNSPDPGIYVVLREGPADGGADPVHVHLVTASGHDVEAHGHTPAETVGRVAIPDPLREIIEAFIGAHHVEEAFRKRSRSPASDEEVRQFGQEPIEVLRARMKQAGKNPGEL
jgi:hypothetical protein